MWRRYDSKAGRWTSPNPYGGSQAGANPQSFNRYSYVGNDSVNANDPLGLFTVCVQTGIQRSIDGGKTWFVLQSQTVCFGSNGYGYSLERAIRGIGYQLDSRGEAIDAFRTITKILSAMNKRADKCNEAIRSSRWNSALAALRYAAGIDGSRLNLMPNFLYGPSPAIITGTIHWGGTSMKFYKPYFSTNEYEISVDGKTVKLNKKQF